MLENKGIPWQQNSHEIEDIKMQLNNGTCKSFKIRDSIICTMDNKIWIPNEKRTKFIENTHEILCHAGFKKVY